MIDTVLFDLDGTLLSMDQDEFVQRYFDRLCEVMGRQGWDPDQLRKIVWAGTKAMLQNEGKQTNEACFWALFEERSGRKREQVEASFLHFYENEFQEIGKQIQPVEEAVQAVRLLRKKGCRVLLATNPLFPRIATVSRIRWAGLAPKDFDWITTYENSRFCKPSPAYYEEVLAAAGRRAEDCLMIGNDTDDDMSAGRLGIQTYLVTDHLVDLKGYGVEPFPHGSMKECMDWISDRLSV